jgi:hypothetical protein
MSDTKSMLQVLERTAALVNLVCEIGGFVSQWLKIAWRNTRPGFGKPFLLPLLLQLVSILLVGHRRNEKTRRHVTMWSLSRRRGPAVGA